MKDDPEPVSSDAPVVRCRSAAFISIAGMFGLLTLLALVAWTASFFFAPEIRAKDEPGAFIGFMLMPAVPTLCLGVLGWRSQIIGDETGLRWRLLWRWKSVAWEDVRDFYLGQAGQAHAHYKVDAPVGTLSFATGTHSNAKLLADLIAQRAINAKAGEWGVRGLRDVDVEPQVFRYGNAENWFFGGLYPVFFGIPTFLPAYSVLTGSKTFREWIWVLLQMPLGLMLIGIIGAFLLWAASFASFLFFVNWAKENWQRRGETIEVTPEGIAWKCGKDCIAARWDEISEFHMVKRPLQHPLYWLETAHGGISFSMALAGFNFLQVLLQVRAPHLNVERKLAGEYTLGDERLKWSGERPGEGTRIFHYRTRLNRAQLWMPTAIALCFLVIPLLHYARPEENGDNSVLASGCFGVLIGIASFFMWLFYFRSSLRVNDEGLEQVNPFGRKFMAWPDIQRLEKTASGTYFVHGKDSVIAIRFALPSDWEELKGEIARRAVKAQNHEWRDTQQNLAVKN